MKKTNKYSIFKTPNSSNVEEIRYYPILKALVVKFNSGKYWYKNVPKNVFEEIQKVESVGNYLFENIKTKFEFEKLNQKKS